MDLPTRDDKLNEIKDELHRLGLWHQHMPQWLHRYEAMAGCREVTFFEWLQFVYLPNKGFQGRASGPGFVAPQAMEFLETVPDKGRLLQLLVELDALI